MRKQRGVIPCAEGIPPSIRRQGRASAAPPPASRPFDGAGLDCGFPVGLEVAKGITPHRARNARPVFMLVSRQDCTQKRKPNLMCPKLGLILNDAAKAALDYPARFFLVALIIL